MNRLSRLKKALKLTMPELYRLLGISQTDSLTLENLHSDDDIQSTPLLDPLLTYVEQSINNNLPKFMLCQGIGSSTDQARHEMIFHTQYPRFLASLSGSPPSKKKHSIYTGNEYIYITQWIDPGIAETQEILHSAANAIAHFDNEPKTLTH